MGWIIIIIIIADVITMGFLASGILRAIFGDGPLGRFLGVIGFIAGALLYGKLLLMNFTGNNLENSDMALVILFAPIGLLLLLRLLSYIFAGQKNKS